MMRLFGAFLGGAAFWTGAAAADVSGPLRIIDADTVEVAGVAIRLFGIDAPELDQPCSDAAGRPWLCGAWAAAQVAEAYGGDLAECRAVDLDRYGRTVARCSVDGQDIGRAIVAAGWATAYRAYSWDYDLEEKAAQIAGLGLWSGTFAMPSAYRAETGADPQEAPGGCLIKGNISDAGQIFHVPGQENYDDTRINEARGERWFCSVADALDAGWRPAQR
jgi:endonuclease YncB( thermonuclease family)